MNKKEENIQENMPKEQKFEEQVKEAVTVKAASLTFKDVVLFLKREIKRNKTLIIGLVVLIVLATLYNFKSQFIVATVQGKPVYRWEIIKMLETQMGEDALNNLIEKRLVQNAANSKGIVVSEDEINLKSKTIEDGVAQSGQTMEQFLEQNGMSMEDYRAQVKHIVLIEKILSDKVTVSEEEVDQYIEENKESFPEIAEDQQGRSLVRESLLQNKLSIEYSSFIAELEKTGGVNILYKY